MTEEVRVQLLRRRTTNYYKERARKSQPCGKIIEINTNNSDNKLIQ